MRLAESSPLRMPTFGLQCVPDRAIYVSSQRRQKGTTDMYIAQVFRDASRYLNRKGIGPICQRCETLEEAESFFDEMIRAEEASDEEVIFPITHCVVLNCFRDRPFLAGRIER